MPAPRRLGSIEEYDDARTAAERANDMIDTSNKFIVGVQGQMINVMKLRARITREEALNLAAYLVLLADPGGEEFEAVKRAIRPGLT